MTRYRRPAFRARSIRQQILLLKALEEFSPEGETPEESDVISRMIRELEAIISERRSKVGPPPRVAKRQNADLK